MEQRTPLGIEFTRALTRQLVISQSYLLGRFVKGTSGALHQVGDYATGLENIAPFVRRDPPHSLRGKGPLAAIFIKLRLRWLLQNYVKPPRRSANYHPCDFILALLYAIMAGLRRINKTEILQYNGIFLSWLGLSRFPDQSTLRRFLKRMGSGSIRQQHHGSAPRLSLSGTVRSRAQDDRKTPASLNLNSLNLQVTSPTSPSILKGSATKSRSS